MVPVASEMISKLLGHKNWMYRHAGLITLSAIAEGCRDTLETGLADVVK